MALFPRPPRDVTTAQLTTLQQHSYTTPTMSKQVTVEEGSASPPPLPKESLPEASTSTSTSCGPSTEQVADIPVGALGEDSNHADGDKRVDAVNPATNEHAEEDEEWDPAEERLPGQTRSAKGKGKAAESEAGEQPWQAVWAAEQNGQS